MFQLFQRYLIVFCLAAWLSPISYAASPFLWAEGPGVNHGATAEFYNRAGRLSWQHQSGDWVDAKGNLQGDYPFASDVLSPHDQNRWVELDLTKLVKMWAKQTVRNEGVLLKLTKGNGTIQFYSKEMDEASYHPTLHIQTRSGQQFNKLAVADTYLDPSTYKSLGDKTYISIGPNRRHALLRFDIDGIKASEIKKATLKIYNFKTFGNGGHVGVYRVGTAAMRSKTKPLIGMSARYPDDQGISSHPNVLFATDFSGSDWEEEWTYAKGNLEVVERDRSHKFKPITGAALKITLPKGEVGAMHMAYQFADKLGYEPEEAYFRYYVRLADDWQQTVEAGKMPGFSGTYGRAGWGGRKPDGFNGWSARGSYALTAPPGNPLHGLTPLGFYAYHVDQHGSFGSIYPWANETYRGYLENNRWYAVEQYVKLNTPHKNDGVLTAWVDGFKVFEKRDMRFRDTGELKIEQLWMNLYHGGLKPSPYDQHMYIDNVVIATEYIGPMLQATQLGELGDAQ